MTRSYDDNNPLTEAAADLRRFLRIGLTQVREVSEEDKDWYDNHPLTTLETSSSLTNDALTVVAEWLDGLAHKAEQDEWTDGDAESAAEKGEPVPMHPDAGLIAATNPSLPLIPDQAVEVHERVLAEFAMTEQAADDIGEYNPTAADFAADVVRVLTRDYGKQVPRKSLTPRFTPRFGTCESGHPDHIGAHPRLKDCFRWADEATVNP